MTRSELNELIFKVFEYDEYPHNDSEPSISATGLLGPKWKAKQIIACEERDESLISPELKRSSTLGTAFHEYAEKIVKKLYPNAVTEVRFEEEIAGVKISGACDLLLPNEDGTFTICDWKTGYGKVRSADQLRKDQMQLSIYRYLLYPHFELADTGYTLFVSQSNNAQAAIDHQLEYVDDMRDWIEDTLYAIETIERCDCFDNVKYNPCNYCAIKNCEHRRFK